MNIRQFLQAYSRSGQELPPWLKRWKRRLSLFFALVVPGLPQILSKKYIVVGSLLFFLGAGALLNMVIGPLSLSNAEIHTFDSFHAIGIPNFSNIYPMNIDPAVASANNLTPIHPPGKPWFVQRFYRELLFAHILLYIVCAIVSFWHQWKIPGSVVRD